MTMMMVSLVSMRKIIAVDATLFCCIPKRTRNELAYIVVDGDQRNVNNYHLLIMLVIILKETRAVGLYVRVQMTAERHDLHLRSG